MFNHYFAESESKYYNNNYKHYYECLINIDDRVRYYEIDNQILINAIQNILRQSDSLEIVDFTIKDLLKHENNNNDVIDTVQFSYSDTDNETQIQLWPNKLYCEWFVKKYCNNSKTHKEYIGKYFKYKGFSSKQFGLYITYFKETYNNIEVIFSTNYQLDKADIRKIEIWLLDRVEYCNFEIMDEEKTIYDSMCRFNHSTLLYNHNNKFIGLKVMMQTR